MPCEWSEVGPGSLPSLTLTAPETALARSEPGVPSGEPPAPDLQVLMVEMISLTILVVQLSSTQPSYFWTMGGHWLPRLVKEFWMSVMDPLAAMSGMTPAMAMAPAARTVRMVEKRMVERLEKATEAVKEWRCSMWQ